MHMFNKVLKTFLYIFFGSLIFLELTIALILTYPSLAEFLPFTNVARKIYMEEYRSVIQYEPACARYDPGVFYTLKPGTFIFSNPEFKTKFFVNKIGIRDKEEDLIGPNVIVLGDSVTMGWGVDQYETYAEIIQNKTGLKVLNAAVSSYGTVREMFMLDRLDTINCKYLIIHYIDNDVNENRAFLRQGNTLSIHDRDFYDDVVKNYLKGKSYYLGKYVVFCFHQALQRAAKILNLIPGKKGSGKSLRAEESPEKLFLNAVLHASRVNLNSVQIIVIVQDGNLKNLKKEIENGDYPFFIKNMIIVRMKFMKENYPILDNHLTARGHRIIAGKILKIIGGD